MSSDTALAAHGKWPGILRHLGVGEEFLTGRPSACPACGGTDRFCFDDRQGNGDYYCRQCGPGGGFDLLERSLGMSFADAARLIDEVVGRLPVHDAHGKKAPPDPAAARLALNRVWSEAQPGAKCVSDYLRARGLAQPVPATLRGHESLAYFHEGKSYGSMPAMLAMVTGPDGKPQSIHRTYLNAAVPVRKKMMTPVDSVRGGAIRLCPPAESLGIAEGIETALACAELFGVPMWSVYSARNMEAVMLPSEVRHVGIFADNDINGVGQRAADILRARLVREGRTATVLVAPTLGCDWLDELNNENKAKEKVST